MILETMLKQVVLLALIACAIAAPSVLVPRKSKVSYGRDTTKSVSKVDSRVVSTGNVQVQQNNAAQSSNQLIFEEIGSPIDAQLDYGTKARTSQKTSSKSGGSIEASQNADSNVSSDSQVTNGGEQLSIEEESSSNAAQNVISQGPADSAQKSDASSTQIKKINNAVTKSVGDQITSANLDERVSSEDGTVKAGQTSTSKANAQGKIVDSNAKSEATKNLETYTKEQISAKGTAKVSQAADAKSQDNLKTKDIATGSTAVISETSDSNSHQQVAIEAGEINSSQKSKSKADSSFKSNSKEGGADLRIEENSSSSASGQTAAKGVTKSSQKESAKATEKQKIHVAGENIDVKDSSASESKNRISTTDGSADSSQSSKSRSLEKLGASIA